MLIVKLLSSLLWNSSTSLVNKALSLWINHLFIFPNALPYWLGTCHCLNHSHKIPCYHISLLLFSSKWSFGWLKSLLFILFFFSGSFWVFSNCTLIRVSEIDRLFFRRHILKCYFLFFLVKNWVNGFMDSLCSCSFIVFIFWFFKI